ncbi:MAG: hypothetical protein QW743_04740 [Candidatus Methanomethylicia archaeon]
MQKTYENEEVRNFFLTSLIMIFISTITITLRILGITIFNITFEALIIYIPTILAIIASIYLFKSKKS